MSSRLRTLSVSRRARYPGRVCNKYRNLVGYSRMVGVLREQLQLPLRLPEAAPNLAAEPEINITDVAPIVRWDEGAAEFARLRWSWPGPGGRPVFNFRSEARAFTSGRCLIPADGFYEFTAEPDAAKGKKTRWLFTVPGEDLFCIAGLWRPSPAGEAFTMLTTEPGPDVAPYHDRQIVVLDRTDWTSWLDPAEPAAPMLRPSPAGRLQVSAA